MTQPRPRRDAGRAGRRPARRFAGHGGTGPSWWPRPARTSTRCTAGAGSAPGAPLGPDLHQAQPHNLDRGRGFGGWRAFRPLLLAQNVGNQGTKHRNPAPLRVCGRWAVGDWQGTNRGPIGDSLT